MNLKYLIPAMAFALPLIATARPVKPGVIKAVNPNGTTVEIRHHGDEHFAFTTEANSNFIVEQDVKGNWQRAVRNGVQLQADEQGLSMLRAEAGVETADNEFMTRAAGPQRMAALDDLGRSKYPCKGTVRSLVVLVEYKDKPFTFENPKALFTDLCNKQGYDAYGARGSARDYYRASSDNQFDVTFDVVGPVKVPYTSKEIAGADGKYSNFSWLIQSALQQLDSEVDFSQYDYDNDGIIDNIYFFYAGFGQADHFGPGGTLLTDLVWPHQSTYKGTLMLDGKKMGPYACSNEINGSSTEENPRPDGIGAFCHEFGHVLGLPDLYDASNGNTEVPNEWTVMCSGSYNMDSTCPPLFSAYERWVCGWIEYNVMEEGKSYSFQAHSTLPTAEQLGKPDFRSLRLSVPKHDLDSFYPNEYFVIENRTKEGYDQSLPSEGIVIWYINYDRSAWMNNRVQYNNNPRVKLIKTQNGSVTWPDGFSPDYIVTDFNPLKLFNGSPKWKYWITDMKYDAESNVASLDYNVITETPTVETQITSVVRTDPSKRNISISWNPADDAKSYRLTLYYMKNGNKSYVNGYNDIDVGNITTAQVNGITSSAWKNEMFAAVRVVGKLPSLNLGPEYSFMPEQLEVGGIDNIAISNVIAVGKGFISAPEGAEIFNLSGMRVNGDNLPRGIYIVRYAGKSMKVNVR